ncbi:MAG: DUF2339 domain-containing protein [Magnetococcales bacterium]|nr:DUF2339 domain-containing protein [Magnetococcales bacterium]
MWLPLGLPMLWLHLTVREVRLFGKEQLAEYGRRMQLVLLFALVTLLIRHAFHGEFPSLGATTNAEIYSYSVAWLLLGIVLLAVGIFTGHQKLRLGALGVIGLTVGKVFLYDMSELTGLYRVFSFLGLGLSLLALSHVYTRFVTGAVPQKQTEVASDAEREQETERDLSP